MGAKRKPTHLKLLGGNPGKRKIDKTEAQPKKAPTVKNPPKYLDNRTKRHWRKVSRELHRCGLLTEIDYTALEMYCKAYSMWREAIDKIEEIGLVVVSKNKTVYQNPYVGIANKQFENMRKMMLEFGMTPSARAGLSAEPPLDGQTADEEDDFEGF